MATSMASRENAASKSPARMWLMILGVTLVLVAILGLISPIVDFFRDNLAVNLDGGEMIVHWILAALTLGLAFGVKNEALLAKITIAYGIVYLLVGVLGFVSTMSFWMLALGDNLLHFLLGAVTIAAGMMSRNR